MASGGAKVMTNTISTPVEGVQEVPCMKTKDILIKNGFKPLCPNPDKERKKSLLETQMNKLGLGRCFDKYFLDDTEKKYLVDNAFRRMGQRDVLTLQEFIDMNPSPKENKFLKTRKEEFKNGRESLLDGETKNFSKLINFLKEYGFSHQDWVGVSPEKIKPHLDSSTKEELIELPAIDVLGIYEGCHPAKALGEYFKKYQKDISIKDLLQLTDEATSNMMDVMQTLQRLQRRLRRLGFTDEDGIFMRTHLDY